MAGGIGVTADRSADEEARLDVEIGARVRALRVAARLSQPQLAQSLGITFQQLQKYETGANRIAASRLVRIAAALEVSPAILLGDGLAPNESGFDDPEVLALVRAFRRVDNHRLRERVLELVRAMGLPQGGT
jgi:transcriptional regulator with XRE-family HTH domain